MLGPLQHALGAAVDTLVRLAKAGGGAPEADGREGFAALVRRTAYRPTRAQDVRAELDRQLAYLPDPSSDGLDALTPALARALAGGASGALPELRRISREHPRQALAHFYAFAAARELNDRPAFEEALGRLADADPGDPVARLLRLDLAGEPVPGIDEGRRVANIAKLARTPLLQVPYQRAVASVFDAIRHRERARVLDIGVGSGAQMAQLVELLAGGGHAVRRLELVALDIVPAYLEMAGETVRARARDAEGRLEVSYEPFEGAIEALAAPELSVLAGAGGIDAVNATIVLHEVPGESKLAALENIRRVGAQRLVVAEWNFCLENVLETRSVEFMFNIRRAIAAMVIALRRQHPLEDARAVVSDWLSMAGGQLIVPASERQECFLDATTWRALLENAGFRVAWPADLAPITVLEAERAPRT